MYYAGPDIREMAEQIIEAKEELGHVRDFSVDYLWNDVEVKTKKGPVLARCYKPTGLERYYCDHDFVVVVYEPNVIDMSEAHLQVIIYHELLHIGEDGKLKDHDINDFRKIIEKYGYDWIDDEIEPIIGGEEDGRYEEE